MAEKTNYEPINPTQIAQNMAWGLDLDDAVEYLKIFPSRRIDEVIKDAIKKKARDFKTTEEKTASSFRERLGEENSQNLTNWLKPGKVKSIDRESTIKIAFALQMTPEEAEVFLKRCWHDGFYMRNVKDVIYRHGLDREWDYKEAEQMIDSFYEFDLPNPNPDFTALIQNDQLTKFLTDKYERSVFTPKQMEDYINQHKQFFGSFRRKAYDRFMGMYNQLKKEWDAFIAEDSKIKDEALEDMERGVDRFIIPNSFFIESVPKEDLVAFKEAIDWLIGSNALELDDVSEDKFGKLKKGITLLFNPKSYEDDPSIKKTLITLTKGVEHLFKAKAGLQDNMTEKELLKLKDRIDYLFGTKAYARDTISSEELCRLIVMGIPNKRNDSSVLKRIAEKIPTRTTMSAIINKSGKDGKIEEVDRKLLILAWLLSGEGAILPYDKGDEKEAYMDHLTIINRDLLEPYGMPSLDPRHPFDWIVMNSLRCTYFSSLDEGADIADAVDRMKELIEAL